MVARLERELARTAPTPHLDVGAVVAPVRNRIVQQIGQPELHGLELTLDRIQCRIDVLELTGQRLAARHQRCGILAPTLRHSHSLRIAVALGANPVRLHLPALTLLLERAHGAHVECDTAAREVARDAWQVAAKQLRIDHGTPFRSLRPRLRWMVASYRAAGQGPRRCGSPVPATMAGSIADRAFHRAGTARPPHRRLARRERTDNLARARAPS